MPETIIPPTERPLDTAADLIGGPKIMQESTELQVVTQRLPAHARGAFVTGLTGHLKSSITVKDGSRNVIIGPGNVWTIRWDYDPDKKVHVNVSIGSTNAVRFTCLIKPCINMHQDEELLAYIIRDQSNQIGYNPMSEDRLFKQGEAADLAKYWMTKYGGTQQHWLI